MSKITLNDVTSFQNDASAATIVNNNSATLETAFENTLSRDGTTPNTMGSDFDMNSYRILNLTDALTTKEPVTLGQFEAVIDALETGVVVDGSYITVGSNSGLNNERVLTAGNNLSLVDAGANSTITVGTTNSPNFTTSVTSPIGTFSTEVVTPSIRSGSAAGSSLTVKSTSNASPSGDILNLYGSTVTLGSPQNSPSIINFSGASGGGVTVNIASASNGLNALNVYNVAGSKQTWVPGGGATTVTFPAATDTLVGKATTDTLTNKTYDTAGTGNSFLINGLAVTANTGTGSVVRATAPTLVTPVLGSATATSMLANNDTGNTGTIGYLLKNNGTGSLDGGLTQGASNQLVLKMGSSNIFGVVFNNFSTFVGDYGSTTASTWTFAAPVKITDATASVTTTTGALIVTGGIGVGGSINSNGNLTAALALSAGGICNILNATAIPAGGTTGSGYKFSSVANFGVFFGSGVPTLSAAQGSLYIRSDGSSTSTRMYINTTGSTTWTNVVTAA